MVFRNNIPHPPHLQMPPSLGWRIREELFRLWDRTAPNLIVTALILAFLLLTLWSKIVYTVKAGERGVLFRRFGGTDLTQSYGEGIHFINPINSMEIYNVRVQEKRKGIIILSNNGLDISITVVYRYFPILDELPLLHQRIGPGYEEVIVTPAVYSSIREVIGRYRPEELYTSHTNIIPGETFTEAVGKVKDKHIVIDAVIIENMSLPPPVQEAIASKHVIEQSLLEYEFKVKREEKEFQRKEIEARGFQRYNELIGSNLSQNTLVWAGIQATRELATSDNAKVIVMGGGGKEGGIGLPLILGGEMSLNPALRKEPVITPATPVTPAPSGEKKSVPGIPVQPTPANAPKVAPVH